MTLRRRLLLAALTAPAVQGCAAPFPPPAEAGMGEAARGLMDRSAAAHGLAALATVEAVHVSYAGAWRSLVGRLQPVLVDAGFRGRSEEHLFLRERRVTQDHTGPDGRKRVERHTAAGGTGAVRVWFNGTETDEKQRLDAAALVADGYGLFLLGPMLLAGQWRDDRALTLALGAPERIEVGGTAHPCDLIQVTMAPGLGFSSSDRLALWIDRDEGLMRRLRFTLDGLEGTRGAVAEVDCWAHVDEAGIRWPTRFHERLLRPVPLSVHDWAITALAVGSRQPRRPPDTNGQKG